jgi:opacity protein-like surface antigen
MRDRVVLVGGAVLALLLIAGSLERARPEVYIAGGAGMTFPLDLRHVRGTGAHHGIAFGNLELANAGVFGGKVGYFFEDKGREWIGVKVEGFVSHPPVVHQSWSGTSAQSVIAGTGEHVRIVTTPLNVLARYPHGRLQPYAGIGLAAVSATVSGPNSAVSDSSPGLNLLAGVKFLLTEKAALICEGRHTYASFQFEDAGMAGAGLKGVYQAPGFIAGVAWRFK